MTGGGGEWFSWPEGQRPDHLTANATEPSKTLHLLGVSASLRADLTEFS
jgi:hypothetical protein